MSTKSRRRGIGFNLTRPWKAGLVVVVVIAGIVITGSLIAMASQGTPAARHFSTSEQNDIFYHALRMALYKSGLKTGGAVGTGNPLRLGLGDNAWIWVGMAPANIVTQIFAYLVNATGLNFTEEQALVLFDNTAFSSLPDGFNPVTGTWYVPGEIPTDNPVKRCGIYRLNLQSNPVFFDATNFDDAAIAGVANLGVYHLSA